MSTFRKFHFRAEAVEAIRVDEYNARALLELMKTSGQAITKVPYPGSWLVRRANGLYSVWSKRSFGEHFVFDPAPIVPAATKPVRNLLLLLATPGTKLYKNKNNEETEAFVIPITQKNLALVVMFTASLGMEDAYAVVGNNLLMLPDPRFASSEKIAENWIECVCPNQIPSTDDYAAVAHSDGGVYLR